MASENADQEVKVKQEERSCDFCSKSLPAQSWCYHCAQPLCQECCQAHNAIKLFAEHVVVPVGEVSEEEKRRFQSKEKCERHKKKLKFFCLQCDLPACSTCAILVHDGHKKTELEVILEEKKTLVQSWCQKVETALPAFQDREASSHARLQRLDSTLQDRVQHVHNLFSRIAGMVKDREQQVLDDLQAKVKGQRETLEEMHRSDSAAVMSARTLVEEGRRVVSLGLPLQLIGQPKKMAVEFQELQAPEEAAVEPLPDLRVDDGDLAALMAGLEKVGEVLQLSFYRPDFKLDESVNPRCSLHEDGSALSNDAAPVAEEAESPDQLNGSITTAAAPDASCYWQVRCLVTPRDRLSDKWLCELGVCDPESLQGSDTWYTSGSDRSSTLVLAKYGASVVLKPYIEGMAVCDVPLAPWSQDAPLDLTVGILLDRPQQLLHVIHVSQAAYLLSAKIQMDKQLWPVLCVSPKGKVRADVRMELQSGARMNITSDTVRLLKSLLDGTYWSSVAQPAE